jgi:hypothetical protein
MSTVRPLWIWLLIALVALPIGSYIVFWASLHAMAGLSEGWHPAWFGDSSYAEIIVLVPDNSLASFFPRADPRFFLQGIPFLASGFHIPHSHEPARPSPGATQKQSPAFVDDLRN